MKADLYHEAILAQAKAATRAGRLDAPDASVTLDNPLCGDRVTIDIRLDGPRISDLAHRVRGCALCQAAASAIGAAAVGQDVGAVERTEAALRAMLDGDRGAATPLWPALAVFEPVRDYKSRHACVLLPFEALRAAIKNASGDGPR